MFSSVIDVHGLIGSDEGDAGMTSEQIRQAAMVKRVATGLKVTLTDTGWEGYFATTEARDEFVARAKALGRQVKIG